MFELVTRSTLCSTNPLDAGALVAPVAANVNVSHCAPAALSTRVMLPAVRQTTQDLPAEYAFRTPPFTLKVCLSMTARSASGHVKEPSKNAQETPVLFAGCSSYPASVVAARDRALRLDSGAGFGAGFGAGSTGNGDGAGIGTGTGTGAVVAVTATHRNTVSPSMLFTGPLGPLIVNVAVVQLLEEGRPQSERAIEGGVTVAFTFAGGRALAAGGFGAAAFGGGAGPACR